MAILIERDQPLVSRLFRGGAVAGGRKSILHRLEDRIFVPSLLLAFGLAFPLLYGFIFLLNFRQHRWPLDASGAPIFIDFISFWTNARFAVSQGGAGAYDSVAFAAAQARFVPSTPDGLPYFHLVYPPTVFPVVAPLGLLPYLPAFIAWLVTTAILYLIAIYRIVPRAIVCMLALAPIAVAKNVWFGQTGFLVAGLLGLSLGLMARAPFLAGTCLGLLTCKPQYGLIFPVVLLVTGQWRMIAGACLTFAILCVVVTASYGLVIWQNYIRAFGTTRLDNFMTDQGLDAIDQTVFGVVHWFGGGFAAKWTVHIVVASLITALVCWIWRRPISGSLKAAALAIGALTVTPYMLGYDLVALTIPVAFLAREGLATGFLTGERLVFLGSFLGLFTLLQVPVAPLILGGLMVLVLRRVCIAT